MTNDTLKSLGYLRRSVKMSKRAININKVDDAVAAQEFQDMEQAMDELLAQIDRWENLYVTAPKVTPAAPQTPVTPAPVDADLLTT